MLIDELQNGKFEHTLSLSKRAFYEFERRACHILLRHRPPLVSGAQLLNLGCGPHIYAGWVNADDYAIKRYFRESQFRPNWRLDITRPWLCENNHWDGIFSEHVLEMLSYSSAIFVLRECLRTLKPAAWVRISLPDLKKYLAIYQGDETQERFYEFPHPALIISNLTQMHFHRSTWDADLMVKVLAEIGFANVRQVPNGEGTDTRLIRDGAEKRFQSFYVEAQKSG